MGRRADTYGQKLRAITKNKIAHILTLTPLGPAEFAPAPAGESTLSITISTKYQK